MRLCAAPVLLLPLLGAGCDSLSAQSFAGAVIIMSLHGAR